MKIFLKNKYAFFNFFLFQIKKNDGTLNTIETGTEPIYS